jgi:uncharacterized protein YdiU (UPF0061 family)
LYPLIEEAAPLESILNSFQTDYEADYASMMRSCWSFTKEENDSQLIHLLTENLQQTETDMTIFFRKLSQIKKLESEEAALLLITDSSTK